VRRSPGSWSERSGRTSNAVCSPMGSCASTATHADTIGSSPSRDRGSRRSLRVDSARPAAVGEWYSEASLPPRVAPRRSRDSLCSRSSVGPHTSLSTPLPLCLGCEAHDGGPARLSACAICRPATTGTSTLWGAAWIEWVGAQPDAAFPHARARRGLSRSLARSGIVRSAPTPEDRRRGPRSGWHSTSDFSDRRAPGSRFG
jgi:hypothetical protein